MRTTPASIRTSPITALRAGALVALVLAGVAGTPAPLAHAQPAQRTAAQAGTPAPIKSVADVRALLSPQLPAGALEITAAMKAAKPGQTVTLRGYVALAKDAFGASESTFTLVDESARVGERPAPDALPATSDAVPAASRATVRVVDASGKPLRASLSGQHGLRPGAEVFVTGTVDSANGVDALVVTASSLHVPRTPLPVGFFALQEPASAADVSEARAAGALKVGDEVVLRGRVGGGREPFVAGRAVFTIVGRGLKACSENPGDNCSRPWDYCCETRDDILANSVTVQAVDARGQVLRTDMKGRRGLTELSEVVVIGRVVSAEGKAVVVNASSIYTGG